MWYCRGHPLAWPQPLCSSHYLHIQTLSSMKFLHHLWCWQLERWWVHLLHSESFMILCNNVALAVNFISCTLPDGMWINWRFQAHLPMTQRDTLPMFVIEADDLSLHSTKVPVCCELTVATAVDDSWLTPVARRVKSSKENGPQSLILSGTGSWRSEREQSMGGLNLQVVLPVSVFVCVQVSEIRWPAQVISCPLTAAGVASNTPETNQVSIIKYYQHNLVQSSYYDQYHTRD